MKGFVIDSYALMAYLEDEPGAGKMERLLGRAEKGGLDLLMSVINWGEVYYSIYRAKGKEKAEDALLVIEQLPIKVVEIDRSLMYQAAKLKAVHSIAIGDCMAAALAMDSGYPVVTGDKEFKKLSSKIRIEWIRGG